MFPKTNKLKPVSDDPKVKRLVIKYIDQLAWPQVQNIKGVYKTIDDPSAAKRFGARSIAEYSYWSWRACAITCLLMVMRAHKCFKGKIFDLLQEALLMNGYAFKNLHGKIDIGWKHNCLIKIAGKRGLKGVIKKEKSISNIKRQIEKGRYCLASVKGKRGSHMVIISEITPHGVSTINPFFLDSGERTVYGFSEFDNLYLRKVIYIWK